MSHTYTHTPPPTPPPNPHPTHPRLQQMCALPLDFKSPLSRGDVGEGLVVRPLREVAPCGPGSRALLKRKAARFLERVRGSDVGGAGGGASLLEMLSRWVRARCEKEM